jgi:glucokinase
MEAVASAYEAGDAAVREVIQEAACALGLAIATVVGTLNVQDIVIAGGVTRLGEPLLTIARQEVLGRCLEALARNTRIEFSAIGSDITALGAAAVLLHQELAIWPLKRGAYHSRSARELYGG